MNNLKEKEIADMKDEKRDIVEITNSFLAIGKSFNNTDSSFRECTFSFCDKLARAIAYDYHDDNMFAEMTETYQKLIDYCKEPTNNWDLKKNKIIIEALHDKYLDLNRQTLLVKNNFLRLVF